MELRDKHNGMTPRTQKAIGVILLGQFWHLASGRLRTTLVKQARLCRDIAGVLLALGGGCNFVRPCPQRPRHGFVDSRVIESATEARGIVWETYAADPDAELLAMPEFRASWSAITTPGGISVGPFHDGATAGRDSVFFATASTVRQFSKRLFDSDASEALASLRLACISDDEHPYVEVVGDAQRAEAVQLRAGPPSGGSADSFPRTEQVREIYRVDGHGYDLVAFEAWATANANRAGLVYIIRAETASRTPPYTAP